MGKIVTSAGLNDFVATGKVETIKSEPKAKPAKEAPALEVVKDKPAADAGNAAEIKESAHADAPADDVADDDETRAEMERSEKLREAIARKNATINRKHREMREAREAAADAEEFAKTQWNEKRLADERNATLEKELSELRAKAAPAAKQEKTKPDPKAFYDDKGQFKAFEYAEELAAYAASKAVEDDRQRQDGERKAAEAAIAERQARARIAETIKKRPDFEEVMAASDIKTHNAVLQYLSASEHIGEVSYYLATHPEFVTEINALNPLRAIARIGRLEQTFEKPADAETKSEPAAKVKEGAPPPIKPLSSQMSANINTDPSKMTYKELRAYERSRVKRR